MSQGVESGVGWVLAESAKATHEATGSRFSQLQTIC